MVTAFFGKKPAPAPASARASKPAASSPAASGKKSPPPAELSSISFTGDSEYELGSADQVQVQEAGSGVGAAYEEAAVLYANGDVREAEAVLDNVLQAKEASSGEGLWMMLLDLYRLTGQKERFESRVLDYATRFERSPPAWLDLSSPGQRMQRRETVPLINLAGSLNAQAAEQCSQIRVIAERSGAIRIDLKRVRNFDEEGCHLLLSLITHLKRERVRVTLINAGHLAEMISGQIAPVNGAVRKSGCCCSSCCSIRANLNASKMSPLITRSLSKSRHRRGKGWSRCLPPSCARSRKPSRNRWRG